MKKSKNLRIGITTIVLILFSIFILSIQIMSLVVSINSKANSEISVNYITNYYRAENGLNEAIDGLNRLKLGADKYTLVIKREIIDNVFLVGQLEKVDDVWNLKKTSVENYQPWEVDTKLKPWNGD